MAFYAHGYRARSSGRQNQIQQIRWEPGELVWNTLLVITITCPGEQGHNCMACTESIIGRARSILPSNARGFSAAGRDAGTFRTHTAGNALKAAQGSSTQGQRFTPTCVGNTICSSVNVAASAVHPHVRGEYAVRQCFASSFVAVHPHVRGEYVLPFIFWACHHRFTPTCVGNTHARVCGHRAMSGSPPRAWGIRLPPRQCR